MASNVTLTVLVENHPGTYGLGAEHGLALWLETADQKILIDTGRSDLVLSNAKQLDIDLSRIDAIVLSHGHYDHTGGLAAVLKYTPRARIYLHPDALTPSYIRKHDDVRFIGMSEVNKQALAGHDLIWTTTPTTVCPGIHVTGQIPRLHSLEDTGGDFCMDKQTLCPDLILDDQSLWIESKQGVSVILGCAHAGVINILRYVAGLAQVDTFYTILGGMHLMHAPLERIIQTEAALQSYKPYSIVPGHCTGEQVIKRWSEVFTESYSACIVGKKFCL